MSETFRGRARSFLVAALLSTSAGCATFHIPSVRKPAPERNWPDALSTAQREVAEGHYTNADSILASFARNYVGSSPALETAYWRALFKMDPTNPDAPLSAAVASLDVYLADKRPREHLTEATTIRRVAAQLESANKAAATAIAQAKDANSTAASARAQAAEATARAQTKSDGAQSADAEITRLKEELSKANAELERIRKRLAAPPTKPPET